MTNPVLRLIRLRSGIKTATLATLIGLFVFSVVTGAGALWSQKKQASEAQLVIFYKKQAATLSHWFQRVDRTRLIGQRVDKGLARYKGELAYLNDSQTKTLLKTGASITSISSEEIMGSAQEAFAAASKAWSPIAFHHEDLLTSQNKYLSPSKKHYEAYKTHLRELEEVVSGIANRHLAELKFWSLVSTLLISASLAFAVAFLVFACWTWWVVSGNDKFSYKLRGIKNVVNGPGLAFAGGSVANTSAQFTGSSGEVATIADLAQDPVAAPVVNWRKPLNLRVNEPAASSQLAWTSETWFEFALPSDLKIAKDHAVWLSPIGCQSLGYADAPAKTFNDLILLLHPEERYTFVQVLRTHLQDLSGKTRFNVHVRLRNAMGNYVSVEMEAVTQRAANGAPLRIRGYWRNEEQDFDATAITAPAFRVTKQEQLISTEVTLSLPGTFKLKGQAKVTWGPEAVELNLVQDNQKLSLSFAEWVGYLHPEELASLKEEWDWLHENGHLVERFYWQFQHRDVNQQWQALALQGVVIKGPGNNGKRLAAVVSLLNMGQYQGFHAAYHYSEANAHQVATA